MQYTATKAKFAAVGAAVSLPTGVELWTWVETLFKWDAPPLIDALAIALVGALVTYFATFFAPANKPVVNSFTIPLLALVALVLVACDNAPKIPLPKFAEFSAATCPYIHTTKEEYTRAWNKVAPYQIAVWAFTENQRQYFPEISKDVVAAQCFLK